MPDNNDQSNVPVLVTEDQVLEYTKQKRVMIVEKIFAGPQLPEDPALIKAGLTALSDMSRDALGKKRLDIETKIGDAATQQAAAAKTIAEVLRRSRDNNFFEDVEVTTKTFPTLGNEVPPPELVKDELNMHPGQLTYNTFMSETETNAT